MLYPAPSSLTYLWNFGVFALVCLANQIVTGMFLAMFYTATELGAFDSIEFIMREVQKGWLLRYTHSNGASMFFIVVYAHIFRGIYYSAYTFPKFKLWGVGVIILFLMIVTGFLGYVLPWGQMSFWAATVITNFVSALPNVGKLIVIWIWGGFAVGDSTLNRFYSLHFVMPFVLLFFTMIHFVFLHEIRSSNSFGTRIKDYSLFYPYFISKDLFSTSGFLIFFSIFVFFIPNYLGHTDNYIPANPIVTPTHIVPEWYYLVFYAILRSIPNKLIGVVALLFSIFVLFLVPTVSQPQIKSTEFRPVAAFFYWFFFISCFVLSWVGGCPAEYPYTIVGQTSTFFYFSYFLSILPLLVFIENVLIAIATYKEQFLKSQLQKLKYYSKIIDEKLKLLVIVFNMYTKDKTLKF